MFFGVVETKGLTTTTAGVEIICLESCRVWYWKSEGEDEAYNRQRDVS